MIMSITTFRNIILRITILIFMTLITAAPSITILSIKTLSITALDEHSTLVLLA